MEDRVSIIVAIFNAPAYTKACLNTLYETDHGYPIIPIVVNNNSRKNATEVISEWEKQYDSISEDQKKIVSRPKVITLQNNAGFSGGVNAALEIVETKYTCILHNDAIVFPNCIKEMVSTFDTADEEVAVIVPRTSYANEMFPCVLEIREKFTKIKPSNKARIDLEEINKMMNLLYPDKMLFLEKLRSEAQFKSTYCPDIPSFCMLAKTELFDKYGKFDKEFWPRGFEDKFWFRKLERDGLVCMIANQAYAHHFGNITSDGPGFCFSELMKINEQRFKEKWAEIDKFHSR
jgi:GT2 family glycosyltransferase